MKNIYLKLLLISSVFIFSSCMDSVELPIEKERENLNKIKINQEEAKKAQEEYRLLQLQNV